MAHQIGFRVPKTILTNNPSEALAFAEKANWDMAVKSLGAIAVTHHGTDCERQYGIFTRRVNEAELRTVVDKISYMPSLLQEYVPKAYELRITCVDQKVFNCRIHSQEDATCAEDFRLNARKLRHEICDMPDLRKPLLEYMDHFRINFGCFDLAVTPSGEPVFFECNPNGQFLWIEEMTGAPISAAVAEMITSNL